MEYGSLNRVDFEDILNDLFYKSKAKPERRFMCYTGEYGMLAFDFAIKFGGTILETFFMAKFKRLPGIMFLSLFKKQGMYKLKIENTTFSFYKGTVLINTIKDVSNGFYLDTLRGVSDTKIKAGIDKVNDYIKTLKDV